MNQFLYVALSGDNKICVFSIDSDSGLLEFKSELVLPGGPGPLAVSPDGRYMYAGLRSTCQISSLMIEQKTGDLTLEKTIGVDADACYLSVDKTGKFLLSSYYGAGAISTHAIDEDGMVTENHIQWINTAEKAHCIRLDTSNRFAFVPHVMRANVIFQFTFNDKTGELTPNVQPTVLPPNALGPRHFCFNPKSDCLYFDNEQGNSVTAYHFDKSNGTIHPFQTVSTLPSGYTGSNTNAQIHITPSGDYLYVSNRGHNSIAMFAVNPSGGGLSSIGQQPTVEIPRAFNIDQTGRFLYSSGLNNGDLESFKIDKDDGSLTPLENHRVGNQPMWVLALTVET